jgi:hypothetical protein
MCENYELPHSSISISKSPASGSLESALPKAGWTKKYGMSFKPVRSYDLKVKKGIMLDASSSCCDYIATPVSSSS